MVDDYPGAGDESTLKARLVNALKSSGVLLAALLRFATPGTIRRDIARHWLILIALAGALLAVVGPIVGVAGTTYVGMAVVLDCLQGWTLQRAFGRHLSGKRGLRDIIFIPLAIVATALIGLGCYKAVELIAPRFEKSEQPPKGSPPAQRRQ